MASEAYLQMGKGERSSAAILHAQLDSPKVALALPSASPARTKIAAGEEPLTN